MRHDIAFLHTAPGHVPTFTHLVRSLAPDLSVAHFVREDLLTDAQADGIESPALIARIREAQAEAGATGAAVVVCTCSTIGGIAETADTRMPYQTTRIDRAMADQAARSGQKVMLVAALPATLKPTAELLHSSAARMGRRLEVQELLVSGAWALFQAGRNGEYIDAIVSAVKLAVDDMASPDITVVLAQASMAPAAEVLAERGIRALASPRLGVSSAVAICRKTRLPVG